MMGLLPNSFYVKHFLVTNTPLSIASKNTAVKIPVQTATCLVFTTQSHVPGVRVHPCYSAIFFVHFDESNSLWHTPFDNHVTVI